MKKGTIGILPSPPLCNLWHLPWKIIFLILQVFILPFMVPVSVHGISAVDSIHSASIEDMEGTAKEFLESFINGNKLTDQAGIVYEINDDMATCKTVSYTGSARRVVIPDTFKGYNVISVGENTFANSKVKSINIGNSVKSIEDGAFAFCHRLYQVIIPESVTKTGRNIFYGCRLDRLTVVTPEGSAAWKYAARNNLLASDTVKTRLSVNKIKDIEGHQEKIYIYNAPSKAKWKSLDKTVAKVNPYGKVTALRPGTAVIKADVSGKTLECRVKVFKRNRKNCLKVIYSKYVTKEMSDYEKIYAAHAWIIQNVKYDKRLYTKGTVPVESHEAEGVFNKGIAVCDGYSKAFMVIMGHYNIPCQMLAGGYHAWNIVKIKNKWYHIDCTYDDPVVNGKFNNRYVYMDFFLKTDGYMYKTHVWNYSAFPKCNSKKIDKNYKRN